MVDGVRDHDGVTLRGAHLPSANHEILAATHLPVASQLNVTSTAWQHDDSGSWKRMERHIKDALTFT
jgi:hypothetical protein